MQRVCPECGMSTEDLTCPDDGEMTLVVKQKKEENSIIGKVIGGRYRITETIGQGGFGAVYKCIHTATGDTLAIKVLRTDLEDNLDVVARFRLEAKATSRLKHPNTVRVFDFGQMDDGNLFLAMEFLDGCTLTDLMRDEGPLEPERLVHIGLQILKSLSEAHSKGLVHRDLKPDNIFVQNMHGEPDFVRVLDFGIAKSMTADQQDITSTGAVIGTPKYMSPEQARGQAIDQRTDLYSLGIMLFEGISGTPPFVAETPLAMILRRVTEEPPRIHDNIALPTPIGLCDAVLKSLCRNPDDRYETADEMAAALSASLKSPMHLPSGHTVGGNRSASSTSTAAYAGDLGSDDTFAYDPSEPGASNVIEIAGATDVDEATQMASADELAVAAAAMGQIAGADGSDDDTIVGVSRNSKSALGTSGQGTAGQGTSVDDPSSVAVGSPKKSSMGVMIGAGIALVVIVGAGVMVTQPTPSDAQTTAPVEVKAAPVVAPTPVVPTPTPTPEPTPVAAKKVEKPAPKPLSLLAVSRQPAEAVVTIDGVTVLGDKHTLAPGTYAVSATAEGYEPLAMKIQAREGAMDLPIRLKKKVVVAPVAAPKRRPSTGRRRPHPRARPVAAVKPKPKPKPKDEGLLID